MFFLLWLCLKTLLLAKEQFSKFVFNWSDFFRKFAKYIVNSMIAKILWKNVFLCSYCLFSLRLILFHSFFYVNLTEFGKMNLIFWWFFDMVILGMVIFLRFFTPLKHIFTASKRAEYHVFFNMPLNYLNLHLKNIYWI